MKALSLVHHVDRRWSADAKSRCTHFLLLSVTTPCVLCILRCLRLAAAMQGRLEVLVLSTCPQSS